MRDVLWTKTVRRTLLVMVGVFVGLIALGVTLDARSPKGIDPHTCEFVLTPNRDATFLKCPTPKGVDIPNWPDHKAPLNGGSPR